MPRSGQVVAGQSSGERLSGRAGVRLARTYFAERARAVARPVTTTLVEAKTRVQQQCEHPPGRGVPPRWGREGGTDMDQRLGAARAGPIVVAEAGVSLLVRGATRQADEGRLRMSHTISVGQPSVENDRFPARLLDQGPPRQRLVNRAGAAAHVLPQLPAAGRDRQGDQGHRGEQGPDGREAATRAAGPAPTAVTSWRYSTVRTPMPPCTETRLTPDKVIFTMDGSRSSRSRASHEEHGPEEGFGRAADGRRPRCGTPTRRGPCGQLTRRDAGSRCGRLIGHQGIFDA